MTEKDKLSVFAAIAAMMPLPVRNGQGWYVPPKSKQEKEQKAKAKRKRDMVKKSRKRNRKLK